MWFDQKCYYVQEENIEGYKLCLVMTDGSP